MSISYVRISLTVNYGYPPPQSLSHSFITVIMKEVAHYVRYTIHSVHLGTHGTFCKWMIKLNRFIIGQMWYLTLSTYKLYIFQCHSFFFKFCPLVKSTVSLFQITSKLKLSHRKMVLIKWEKAKMLNFSVMNKQLISRIYCWDFWYVAYSRTTCREVSGSQ